MRWLYLLLLLLLLSLLPPVHSWAQKPTHRQHENWQPQKLHAICQDTKQDAEIVETTIYEKMHNQEQVDHHASLIRGVSRASFFRCTASAATSALLLSSPALAFEGGVGGLGKTKPETGVEFFMNAGSYYGNAEEKPIFQDLKTGIVQAELVMLGQPVLASFYAPAAWPLSVTAAGLEARDLAQPESAYVHIVTTAAESSGATTTSVDVSKLKLAESKREGETDTSKSLSRSVVKEIVLDSVLSQQGKFGAYGSPTDVKVKKWRDVSDDSNHGNMSSQDLGIYQVSFTTLTPGLRESERVLLVSMRRVVASGRAALAMLVTGTTRVRFQAQLATLDRVANSWQVVPAPSTRLLRS